MKVGITVDNPDTVVAEARRAEELGFDILGCGEHLFFHGPTPNSFAMLAAAAAVTSRIRLVSSIALLPLYPAVVVAKMASVIDCISDGRFELGVGAGGEYPAEFAAAGIDPGTRFRRLDEGLEVIRRLFEGGPVDFQGSYATLSGVALDPPPRQPGAHRSGWEGVRTARCAVPGATPEYGCPTWSNPSTSATDWPRFVGWPLNKDEFRTRFRRRSSLDGGRRGLVTGAKHRCRRRQCGLQPGLFDACRSLPADRYARGRCRPAGAIRRGGVDTVLIQVAAGSAEHRSRIIETFATRVLPGVRDL